MFNYIWHTFFFDPVYNILVFFIDVIPGGDVGLAIIATVILVKLILFPISIKAVQTQKVMKEVQPKLKEIKDKFKDDREEQAKAMMAVYKEHNLKPFSSILIVLLQIPIIIALYYSVYSGAGGVALPEVNVDILYSLIKAPVDVTMNFIGLIDIAGRSALLAALAGLTQYVHINFVMPKTPEPEPGKEVDLQTEIMGNMQKQMKFVMPILITGIAYFISAAIALYFVVSNIFALLQELYVRRHR